MGDPNASVNNFGFNSTLNSSWLKTYDKLGILGTKKGKPGSGRGTNAKTAFDPSSTGDGSDGNAG